MAEGTQIALDEGASTTNLVDTVSYVLPHEHGTMVEAPLRLVLDLRGVVVSVHCHNELGSAVANWPKMKGSRATGSASRRTSLKQSRGKVHNRRAACERQARKKFGAKMQAKKHRKRGRLQRAVS